MTSIIENKTDEILFYDSLSNEALAAEEFLKTKRKINSTDLDAYLDNKLLNLRSPGTYKLIANAFAVPPKTSWSLCDHLYTYHTELNKKTAPQSVTLDTIERSALLYSKKFATSPITVECSGGLDSSIVIDFLIRHGFEVCLVGFTSDRYEFRTERKIQEFYFSKVKSSISLSYESTGAFENLKGTPLHPLPAQECLSHHRHTVAANATLKLNSTLLLSGEAGDQLLGMQPKGIVRGQHIPPGYYYWSLAEKWSDQFIYNRKGVHYISALAIGSLPSQILSMRADQGEDHMKIWARQLMSDKLPAMLTKHAFKAFHDGWVMDGLDAVIDEIAELGKVAHDYLGHPELTSQSLVSDSLIYKSMSNTHKIRYLGQLTFATWIYSLAREDRLI